MSAIINIGNVFSATPTPTVARQPVQAGTTTRTADGDTIELSSVGRTLSRGVEPSSLSAARTRAIRAEIENGVYETPERIHGTVQRLLDVIG